MHKPVQGARRSGRRSACHHPSTWLTCGNTPRRKMVAPVSVVIVACSASRWASGSHPGPISTWVPTRKRPSSTTHSSSRGWRCGDSTAPGRAATGTTAPPAFSCSTLMATPIEDRLPVTLVAIDREMRRRRRRRLVPLGAAGWSAPAAMCRAETTRGFGNRELTRLGYGAICAADSNPWPGRGLDHVALTIDRDRADRRADRRARSD